MKREYRAVRKGKIVKIYGTRIRILTGGLTWGKIGTIRFNDDVGEYNFEPSWSCVTLCSNIIEVIKKEMDRLKMLR